MNLHEQFDLLVVKHSNEWSKNLKFLWVVIFCEFNVWFCLNLGPANYYPRFSWVEAYYICIIIQ